MNFDNLSDEELMRLYEAEPMTLRGSGRRTDDEIEVLLNQERDALDQGLNEATAARSPGPEFEAPGQFRIEPDRPKFRDVATEPARKGGVDDKGRTTFKEKEFETEEIKKLLGELERAQASDKGKAKRSRTGALTLRAGQAVSSGMGGLKPENIEIPDKYQEAPGVEKRARLGSDLQTAEMKRQNPELERENKIILKDKDSTTKKEIEGSKQLHKSLELEDKQEHDVNKTNQTEAGKLERAKIMARAGLAGKILQQYASAGTQGAREDAKFANDQSTRQIPGLTQTKPNSNMDHKEAADLKGSYEAIRQVGGEMSALMRKEGRNFPQGTAWKNLAGDYMAINQALNHLNKNGVMNFKDQENNNVQIGNAQEFVQYVLNNGPDVLDHSIGTMGKMAEQNFNARGYKTDPSAQMKTPSQYLGGASGGGQSRNPVDPNVAGKLGDWATQGGQFPNVPPPQANPPPGGPAPAAKRKVLRNGKLYLE